jgi:predicted metalloenzyme YecM
MILSNYKNFIDETIQKIKNLGIDTSDLTIDHLGYQAASDKDYEEKKNELKGLGKIKHDVQVGEVKVAIFQLNTPLKYENQFINAIEIVSPKSEQIEETRWEHIEFVLKETLESFVNKYPNLNWNLEKIDREIFPMASLKLDEKTRVKFPKRPVLEEVKRIKLLENND